MSEFLKQEVARIDGKVVIPQHDAHLPPPAGSADYERVIKGLTIVYDVLPRGTDVE